MFNKVGNITLLFIFFMNIEIGWSYYNCADCHSVSSKTCEIEADNGFSCGEYKTRRRPRDTQREWVRELEGFEKLAHKADSKRPQLTEDLKVCVPSGLNVTDKFGDNHPICCVWSRELGCQILANEENDLWDCGVCHKPMHFTYDNLKPCPCVLKESSQIRTTPPCGLRHLVIAMIMVICHA